MQSNPTQMTDKERIRILKKAKELISNNYYTFLCPALNHVLNRKVYTTLLYSAFEVFPELIKYKPKIEGLHGAWFGGSKGKDIRIETLNSLIKELKAKQ